MAVSDGFRNPALAVDAIALREGASVVEVLLIRRGHPPYKGRLAFPGGFGDIGRILKLRYYVNCLRRLVF